MYSVLLDINNYYTGSYVLNEKIHCGIDISSLPPTNDKDKALCYKYDATLGWIFDEQKYNIWLLQKLENNKQIKIKDLKDTCQTVIFTGLDVTTTLGTEHFSFEITDQLEIDKQHNNVLNGATEVIYHADFKEFRNFTAQEITDIYNSKNYWILYNRTYYNLIKEMVNNCNTVDEINAISWGIPLSSDLDNKFISVTGVSTIKS